MRKMLIAGALLFSLTANSGSEQPTQANGDAAKANETAGAQPAAEKKVCRRVQATESRLAAKRVCKTAEEWKRAQE